MSEREALGPSIKFDRYQLDVEGERQVELTEIYADLLADAKRDLSEAEEVMEVASAHLANLMRLDPDKYGLGSKASETAIKMMLPAQPQYAAARLTVREMKYRVDQLAGKMRGMDARGGMLKDSCKLWLAGYFADPKLASIGSGNRNAMEEVSNKRIFGQHSRDQAGLPSDC